MSCYLLFALKLEQQDSQVLYDPEEFVDHAVVISVPEVKEIISRFISTLRTVAVVEEDTKRRKTSIVENDEAEVSESIQSLSSRKLNKTTVPLRPVATEAYICKIKDLDRSATSSFNLMCSEIATYLEETLSKVSSENLLEIKLNPIFSGIREVIDLRNYLSTYVKNPNNEKMYNEGFIYVMNI